MGIRYNFTISRHGVCFPQVEKRNAGSGLSGVTCRKPLCCNCFLYHERFGAMLADICVTGPVTLSRERCSELITQPSQMGG